MCCDSIVESTDTDDDTEEPLFTLGSGLCGGRGGGRAGSSIANDGVLCGVAASGIGRTRSFFIPQRQTA